MVDYTELGAEYWYDKGWDCHAEGKYFTLPSKVDANLANYDEDYRCGYLDCFRSYKK